MDLPIRRVGRRHVLFHGPTEKAQWLDAAASLDASDPMVQVIASRIVGNAGDADAVRLLHEWVRDRIAYVRDAGGKEEFADTRTIIDTGYDDCDGKSRTFVALVRALDRRGVLARIRPVLNKRREFVHVQAEAKWPGSDHFAHHLRDGWVLAELIVKGCALGDDPVKVIAQNAGRVDLAGPKITK